MVKRAIAGCGIALCLMCMACGGRQSLVGAGHYSTPPPSGPLTKAETLAQLDALPTPAGVEAKLFGELKGALRAMLVRLEPSRFASTPPTGLANQVDDLTTGVDDNGMAGIQWNYKNVADYNFDSEVNISDLVPIGQNFHKTTASPDWQTVARFADGDGNGEVNISDITPIGANFHHKVAGYLIQGGPTVDNLGELDQVGFEDSAVIFTGMRMFHYLPAVQQPVYRVIPLDDLSALGEPSLPSIEFMISEKTRVVGQLGGPSFVSRAGDDLVLNLPPGAPSPIEPGDVVVGAEDGGYLLRVLDVLHTGDQLELTTEPGILADVFLQGGLSEALDDISQVPPAVYTLDLRNQQLCDYQGLTAYITDGSMAFLPQADVAVNYNQYGGVTYLRGLALGGPLDLDMTVQLTSEEWSGPFPPTPAEAGFFEHKMTGFTFDFTAYQNGVPVTMALQYDVYVGIRGSGDYFGLYQARIISKYENVKMGGVFNSTGVTDYNEFTPSYGAISEPILSTIGDNITFTAYIRPEIHIRLYGNPIPGNTENLALTLAPQLTLSATRTSTPELGWDYNLQGSMDTSYLLILNHIGMDEDPQSKFFPGTLDSVLSGFIPDFVPPT